MNIQINTSLHIVLRFCLLFSTLGALFACKTTSSQSEIPYIAPNAFAEFDSIKVESTEEIFQLTQDAYNFVDKYVAGNGSEKDRVSSLVYAIFDRSRLGLKYQADANTTASETFVHGTANCISLTIMTYAMTEYMGVDTRFQDVLIPEFWTRRNGSTLINRHINLKVELEQQRKLLSRPFTIDFDPQRSSNKFDVKELSKSEIVSYFYSNKAADFLINKEPGKALAYLRAAIDEDLNNESAWLNLGVLFSRYGLTDEAKLYYQYAIELKPNNASAYENLALLYRRLGDHQKANLELRRLHSKRMKNPYYHTMLGDKALEQGEATVAIKHYLAALGLNKRVHQFHFNLAKAYYANGDLKKTKKYLESAQKRAKDADTQQRYVSKMALFAHL